MIQYFGFGFPIVISYDLLMKKEPFFINLIKKVTNLSKVSNILNLLELSLQLVYQWLNCSFFTLKIRFLFFIIRPLL